MRAYSDNSHLKVHKEMDKMQEELGRANAVKEKQAEALKLKMSEV